METVELKNKTACPLPELSAYIDGEMTPNDELELERHLSGCRVCTDDLNLQKSFLNALDYSFESEIKIELPKDFTKFVVTNAESRVSGLRRPHERRIAAFICIALIVFSFFALGSGAGKTLAAATAVLDKMLAVIESVAHLFYDIALGSTIVLRSLASTFLFGSGVMTIVTLVAIGVSLYLFSRLLARLRRT
jgi:hypothetical protein